MLNVSEINTLQKSIQLVRGSCPFDLCIYVFTLRGRCRMYTLHGRSWVCLQESLIFELVYISSKCILSSGSDKLSRRQRLSIHIAAKGMPCLFLAVEFWGYVSHMGHKANTILTVAELVCTTTPLRSLHCALLCRLYPKSKCLLVNNFISAPPYCLLCSGYPHHSSPLAHESVLQITR